MSRFDICLGIAVGGIIASVTIGAFDLEPIHVATAATVPFTLVGIFLIALEAMTATGGEPGPLRTIEPRRSYFSRYPVRFHADESRSPNMHTSRANPCAY